MLLEKDVHFVRRFLKSLRFWPLKRENGCVVFIFTRRLRMIVVSVNFDWFPLLCELFLAARPR